VNFGFLTVKDPMILKGAWMSHAIRSVTLTATVALLTAASAGWQDKGKPASDEQPGLQVGEKAPKFTLKNQEGQERSLDDLLKKGKVALVFYRSADW
jgi:cytochrome oxidase Cu insertion factor (SCO1/SenC/PrrC family)